MSKFIMPILFLCIFISYQLHTNHPKNTGQDSASLKGMVQQHNDQLSSIRHELQKNKHLLGDRDHRDILFAKHKTTTEKLSRLLQAQRAAEQQESLSQTIEQLNHELSCIMDQIQRSSRLPHIGESATIHSEQLLKRHNQATAKLSSAIQQLRTLQTVDAPVAPSIKKSWSYNQKQEQR